MDTNEMIRSLTSTREKIDQAIEALRSLNGIPATTSVKRSEAMRRSWARRRRKKGKKAAKKS